MSHQDHGRKVRFHYECLRRALVWLLPTSALASMAFRKDCTWSASQLAAAALLWAWSDESTLGERFQTARKIVQTLFPRQQEPAGSYQAFTKLLRRWTDAFVECLQQVLRRRMQQALASRWLVHGFAVFGTDGSRIELPRTRSNEEAYAPLPRSPAEALAKARPPAAAIGHGAGQKGERPAIVADDAVTRGDRAALGLASGTVR